MGRYLDAGIWLIPAIVDQLNETWRNDGYVQDEPHFFDLWELANADGGIPRLPFAAISGFGSKPDGENRIGVDVTIAFMQAQGKATPEERSWPSKAIHSLCNHFDDLQAKVAEYHLELDAQRFVFEIQYDWRQSDFIQDAFENVVTFRIATIDDGGSSSS